MVGQSQVWSRSGYPRGRHRDTAYWEAFIEVVTKVRQAKTKAQKPMNAEIILTIPEGGKPFLREESGVLRDLRRVTNAKEIKTGDFKVEFV